ncbi:glycosyltransferase family 2 protein [Synechococcus sp. CS-1332]|uniref:glycosyltransferase family 2 protein n=1 Tax=Synechococcus sp. CS-1332 TaxID=2847972 RepID=UPI00223C4B9A|nr:glycosyltransferase [Synechococcus sp. CS-1332]MCT0206132.1 glycosyltransferase [Synechococcus sp. CS-1332]
MLEAVVAAGERAGELLRWARLFAALSLRAMGSLSEARKRLAAITAEGRTTEFAEPQRVIAFHAGLALSWLHFSEGERAAAVQCLQELRQSPLCEENSGEVDLLGRVISTLEWLESHPREDLSHAVDRAEDCSFVAAVDAIRISPCGTLLQIEGWVVDPGKQMRELCLVRGDRVWRLDMGEASYSSRPDLAAVLQRCHASGDLHPGLRLQILNMPEERHPLQAGEAAELFVVLNNGLQFCIRRTLQRTELQTDQLKEVLDVAISHPTHLQAPMLLKRVRETWSQQLLHKMDQPAEHNGLSRGLQPAPELSVVVPLYGRVDFMEYQLNWFNAWRRRHGDRVPAIQLIYVLDDPRMKQEFNALAKRCHTLFSVPFETVINPINMGFAGANNRGVQLAKAPLLLLLNSDVLPASDTSLELMLRAMQQHGEALGALGARLLYDNGAIQHCGMEFVTEPDLEGDLSWLWLNEHPLKGVNTGYSLEQQLELQEVEAATAACLMLRTGLYRELKGLSSHYVVGDFEDSDLCLKIRQRGLPIAVDLAAVFFHLERQSVGLGEKADTIKAKIVAANAITHHQRWCSAIERLKRSRIEVS